MMLNFFKNKNSSKDVQSQSWESHFGFSFFQNVSLDLKTYSNTKYRQLLDEIRLLQDLPLAQERLDEYLDRLFERTHELSRVQLQSMQLFEVQGSAQHSWNEVIQMIGDLCPVLGVPFDLEFTPQNQGIETKRMYVSALSLGLVHLCLDVAYSQVTIKANPRGFCLRLHGLVEEIPLDEGANSEAFQSLLSLLSLDFKQVLHEDSLDLEFKALI